ncbi:hypothetical protein LCGC14_1044460 [marine sediment metagenome]|uniref:Uncharacterized protein n=1 Tax=marine sediment metagenome TaxID=412755 RepID=A0A0F9MQQ6_9ZZZZ
MKSNEKISIVIVTFALFLLFVYPEKLYFSSTLIINNSKELYINQNLNIATIIDEFIESIVILHFSYLFKIICLWINLCGNLLK